MLTPKQLDILSVFHNNIFASLTFQEIKQTSKQNSNNMLQLALERFRDEGILLTKKTGNVSVYQLNLGSNLALAYMSVINELRLAKAKLPHELIRECQNRVSSKTAFFILAIFGSYAKGKATGKSDLDMAVIVDSSDTVKQINPVLETIKRREILPIDYHVISADDFTQMLSAESENLGIQIYKNCLIYCGYPNYMRLIRDIHERRGKAVFAEG